MRGRSHHLGEKLVRAALHPPLRTADDSAGSIRSRGRLKHTSTAIMRPIDGISQAYALGGRLLILFTAILIFVMPWTEYFCQLDRFLRGGQDCELGLLALLTIFSLVLVLLKQRRQSVTLLLAVRRSHAIRSRAPTPCPSPAAHYVDITCPSKSDLSLPARHGGGLVPNPPRR
jgi:hypothetical protein